MEEDALRKIWELTPDNQRNVINMRYDNYEGFRLLLIHAEGTIRELGNGRIRQVFTDDIDTIEILLAHAIPEGIGNLIIPAVIMAAMFFVDWKLALLSLAALPLGLLAMGMMFKVGMSRMNAYYGAAAKMNNTRYVGNSSQ